MTIEVENLSYGYRGKPVGEGVSLAVAPGEVLALLGPNGAGKTTLFKAMLGLIKPWQGAILLEGRDLASFSRAEVAREIAFVPQAHAALFPYSVLDVVLMARASRLPVFGLPGRHDRDISVEALASLGIEALAHRPYTELSGGERQIVLIARALAQQTRYLVLDEPTASLDYGNQIKVLAHIRDLARRGIGVVLSTHNPDHVFLVAHRVALLHQNHLISTGSPIEVLTPEVMKRIYGVDVVIGRVPGSENMSLAPVGVTGEHGSVR